LIPFYIGITGIDFGYHWDENDKIIKPIAHSVRVGSIFPKSYYYPSLLHEIGMTILYSQGLFQKLLSSENQNLKEILLEKVYKHDFLIQMRSIIVLFSSLTAILIYFTVLTLRNDFWEALVASLLFISSWEISYHSRWLTVDPLAMFFGTLTLLFISKFIKSMPSQLWIDLAAISAGITAGSKYNGGLVLILVLVAAFLNLRTNFDKKIFKLIFRIIVFSALSFFLTTPGIIFEWRILLSHLKFQFVTYNSGHFGYTVQSVWQHLFVLCEYFLCSVPSKYLFLSILISSLAILGLLDLFKKDKKNFYLWFLVMKNPTQGGLLWRPI
jgi:4-amino-4-deoxy-L-arabinose transferase-like glycosyltransferase